MRELTRAGESLSGISFLENFDHLENTTNIFRVQKIKKTQLHGLPRAETINSKLSFFQKFAIEK